MKKYFLVFALMLITAVALVQGAGRDPFSPCVLAAGFQGEETCRRLRVSATGRIKAEPDIAIISISIETKSVNLEEAQRENSERFQNLIMSLKNEGVNESNVQTVGFYIYPEYDYSYGQKFSGYKVSNQLNIRLKGIDGVGKMIDAITEAGANIVSGVQFQVKDAESIYNSALEKAVELAKEKATILAKCAEVENIKMISIKENQNNFSRGYENAFCAKSYDVAGTTIKHNEIEILATVDVVFEIS